MNSSTRFARTIVAASALALTLAACGGGSGGGGAAGDGQVDAAGDSYDGPDVSLTMWNPFTGADGAYFQQMVDDFNAENENIDLTATPMDAGDMYGKLPTAVKSNRGPDVALIHVQSVPGQAAQGTLLGLDTVVEALELTEDDFSPDVWQAGLYQDTRYSVPLDMHMLGLFYNKQLFEEAGLDPEAPPQTLEEYTAALEALKANGVQGHWQPTMDEWGFRGLIKQFGGEYFNEEGTEATFNSEAGVEALTWMRSLIDDGYSPTNVDDPWKAFISETNAMGFFGIWSLGDPALDELEWGVAAVPVIGDEPGVWGSSHQFVVTTQVANDENKEAAAAYVVNQLSANSIEWAKANQVPARASVRESPEFAELTNIQPFAEQIDHLALNPALPGLDGALDPINQAINKVMVSGTDPKQALDEAVTLTNAILKDNQAKFGY